MTLPDTRCWWPDCPENGRRIEVGPRPGLPHGVSGPMPYCTKHTQAIERGQLALMSEVKP